MGSLEMSADNIAIGNLTVTDNVRFPNVTFTGTAQSVHKQMKRLKPESFSNVDNVEIVQARSLPKRSSVILQGLNHRSLATHTDSIVNRLIVPRAISFSDRNLAMMAKIT
jgi:hypothetical protein